MFLHSLVRATGYGFLMTEPILSGVTLDDVMRLAIEGILDHGDDIAPTKGEARELTGVLIELTNPRARLSRTETRGKPYSCLGELCWYLAKTNKLSFISYYVPVYEKYADGDEIFGGYGPRLFDWGGVDQIRNVISILRNKPQSRQAVVQLFDAHDLVGKHNDVPCTCTLQFMIRRDKLLMFVNMRSNDAYWGLPHDVFCFTMLQEIVARALAVELGTYKHAVGSLHLYEKSIKAAQQFLDEGWQPTNVSMPQMPVGDPWPSIALLLEAESDIRIKGQFDNTRLAGVDSYWADLVHLLQVYRCKKEKDPKAIEALRRNMSSEVYDPFIQKVLGKFS